MGFHLNPFEVSLRRIRLKFKYNQGTSVFLDTNILCFIGTNVTHLSYYVGTTVYLVGILITMYIIC